MTKVDLNNYELTDEEGKLHKLFPEEFWHIAPNLLEQDKSKILKGLEIGCENSWVPISNTTNMEVADNDHSVHPIELGLLLHNACIGEGIVGGMDELLKGIEIKPNKKNLYAYKAEAIFEKIREESYPDQPSRLRCHFLSLSREIAEERLKKWKLKNRTIVRCYLILSSGRFHYANIKEYEDAARSTSDERITKHAHKYFEKFVEGKFPNAQIEVLADSGLYFPEWRTFPQINLI